jgi:predicted TIM-barrel fold metal-dependent hydrolase
MKIDIFAHILPKKYFEALRKKVKGGVDFSQLSEWVLLNRALSEIDIRLRLMDRYPDVLQVLTLALPPLEVVVSASDAIELAKIANDEMAELVLKYPDSFVTAVACLPLNDIDAAIEEADRAITELKFKGVQIFSNINGEPLDERKFRPLYERMVQHDLPLWIHPWNSPKSVQEWVKPPFMGAIGWDFETSLAMLRLVHAGVFKDYPNIKFITHHCGGMVPICERRFKAMPGIMSEDVRKFYNDTALYGNTAGLMCGYAFFGAAHLLFGTDMPLGSTRLGGYGYTLETIHSIEQMDIPAPDKDKIFEDNARQLLKLTL